MELAHTVSMVSTPYSGGLLTLRSMMEWELPGLASLMVSEQRHVSAVQLDSAYQTYGSNCFIGAFTPDNRLLASCCALPCDSNTGYISCLLVAKELRRQGIEAYLLQIAMDILKPRSVFTQSPLDYEGTFLQCCFFKDGNGISVVDIDLGSPSFLSPATSKTVFLEQFSKDNIVNVIDYQSRLRLQSGPTFRKKWLEMSLKNDMFGFIAVNKKTVQTVGFIALLPGTSELSCLYASNIAVAHRLLAEMIRVCQKMELTRLRVNSPTWNTEGVKALLGIAGMTHSQPIKVTHLMSTAAHHSPSWHHIYSISNDILPLSL